MNQQTIPKQQTFYTFSTWIYTYITFFQRSCKQDELF